MTITVSTQRTTVHAITKADPAKGTCPSMAEPIEAPNTISAEAIPPSTAVTIMSTNAISRLGMNLRSTGTS